MRPNSFNVIIGVLSNEIHCRLLAFYQISAKISTAILQTLTFTCRGEGVGRTKSPRQYIKTVLAGAGEMLLATPKFANIIPYFPVAGEDANIRKNSKMAF